MARPRRIEREAILSAALELVDEEGLDGLSMRRLGKRLGVEAMSLYNHVSNKQAILDGVFEQVVSEIPLPPRSGDWREDVKALARGFRRVLLAHPHAMPLFTTRPAVTEASLELVEWALGILPFAELERRVAAFQVVVTFVIGHAVVKSGIAEAQVAGDLYASLSPQQFPQLSAVPSAAQVLLSDDEEFRFGLEALVQGLGGAKKF